ncbi:uncharacterized protein [Typha latifolia]|uniref:uncharacterized protein n=1 Tax=Typha latifolia TaxID=4733 RepID=UPI003C2EEEC5
MRDHNGGVVQVRWEPIPAVSPLHAEAWAMLMGLNLLSREQTAHVESDSEQLVKVLRGERPCPWQIQGIVWECKVVLAKVGAYSITHVSRLKHKAADWTARKGLGATQIGTLREGDPMPHELYILVQMDNCSNAAM